MIDTLKQLREASEPTPVVAIIGGAVSGSEAAALCAERGAIAVVFEQGERPYGKIEDGLPRWHVKLRQKEYQRIDENLGKPGVVFVPNTEIGVDIAWEALRDDYGLSAIVLANGAWRDRPLPVEGADAYVDRGLVYQNPFVYWFNRYPGPDYAGPTFEVLDGAIVVGGGLASIDVVKIINLELYARALGERGIEVDIVELEVKGIDRVLEGHGLTPEELGVAGCTLYYRRSKEDMPLASIDNPTPEQLAKLKVSRAKIMDRVIRKYLVKFEELHRPVATIVEGDRLAGLRFERTEVIDGRVKGVAGSEVEVRAPMVVSSIGSVPKEIPGVPTRGELYAFEDWDRGTVDGLPGVFGLGNVLTGKGNIRDSRQNAIDIIERSVSHYLGLTADTPTPSNTTVRQAITPTVTKALAGTPASPQAQHALAGKLAALGGGQAPPSKPT